MIVIGVDTHKRSHTLVALDAATGAARGQLTIPASEEGTLDACGSRASSISSESGLWRTAGTYPAAWSEDWSRAAIGSFGWRLG